MAYRAQALPRSSSAPGSPSNCIRMGPACLRSQFTTGRAEGGTPTLPPSCAVLTAARHPALTGVFKTRTPTLPPSYGDGSGNWSGQYQTLRLSWLKFLDYFFTPKTPSFAALATRNLTTVLAGILIFCCVFGLKPVRAFLFCFTSFAKTGQNKFAVLFSLFVGERAERIEKYSSGPFVGLGGFSKCALKFGFCHL
jgi:hypothetical protein